ncbi:MAG: S8 family serine peptidase, partial [Gracilibacteraceae bacterium]|nr:S8 family serine peptidase [Gracilibacteraceae bacterium]
LVKLPAAAGSAAITAHSLRVWPQGVLSASLLLRAAESDPAPVYGVAADTAGAEHYVVSPDVAAYSLPGPETGSEAGPEAGDWYVLQVEEGSVSRILAGLLTDTAVLAAEPDYLVSAAPFAQGELQAAASFTQYHLENYGIPEGLSQINSPGHGVRVAVVDSGVDITHPDLAMNIDAAYPGRRNFTGSGNLSDVSDGYGHGTMVAGLIAAKGLARGVATEAKIIPLKVLDNSGSGNTSNLIAAMSAVRGYADIINLSLGSTAHSEALDAAVLDAWQAGCLVVCSAGNEGLPNGPADGSGAWAAIYPAASLGAIGVMAAAREPAAGGDRLAVFSNWDVLPDDRVEYHVLAPGSSLQSTMPGGGYRAGDGTSFATPVVSGMAAALLSALRDARPGQTVTNAELFSRVVAGTENVRGKTVAGKSYTLRQVRLDKMLQNQPAPAFIIDDSSLRGDLIAGGAANSLSLEIFTLRGQSAAATLRVTSQTAGVRFAGDASSLDIKLGALAANSSAAAQFNVFVSPSVANGEKAKFTFTVGTAVFTLSKPVTRLAHISGDLTAGRSLLDPSAVWVVDSAASIPAGKALTVAPGTEVRFEAGLVNFGVLNIAGTETRPVVLRPGTQGDRVSIVNSGEGARSALNYVTVTNPDLRVTSINHAYWSGHGAPNRPLRVEAASIAHSQAFDFRQAVIKADLDACAFSYLAGVSVSGGSVTNCTFMNNIMPSESNLPLTSLDLTGGLLFRQNAVLTPLRFTGSAGAVYDLSSNYFDLTHSAFASAPDFSQWNTPAKLASGCTLRVDPSPSPALTAECPPFILYAESLSAAEEISGYSSNRLILTFNTDMAQGQPVLELLHGQNALLTPVSFYDKRAVSGEWIGPRTWQLKIQTDVPAAFVSAAGLRGAKDKWLYTADGERRLQVALSVARVTQSVALQAAADAAGVTLTWDNAAGSAACVVYRQQDGEAPQNMGAQKSPWRDSSSRGAVCHYYIRAGNGIASNIVTVNGSGGSGGGGSGGGGGGSG